MGWRASPTSFSNRLLTGREGPVPTVASPSNLYRLAAHPALGTPRVRVVVVHHSGADLTIDCLRSLCETEWPDDRLEIVLVDNGSSDRVAARARAAFPQVEVIESPRNLGFAGGCNAALACLDDADYVAFLNNDVTVERHWLTPLVDTLQRDPTIGAVCPKILFADSYVDVKLQSPTTSRGFGDRRQLGVRLSGVRLDGEDGWRRVRLVDGFWGREYERGKERPYQWTTGRAHLRVPVRKDRSHPDCELLLAAGDDRSVVVQSGPYRSELTVGREPRWHPVALGGEPFDVINNVGSMLLPGGYGADRGYLERDEGQFEEPVDVFAWCGAAVLVSRRYLETVGKFEERLFLYYEDFDLSWRAQVRGWRHTYVPGSVVRHVHGASAIEGSRLHEHHVERNRLLMLLRNASPSVAAGATCKHLLITASYVRRDVISPLFRGEPSSTETVRRRMSAFADYVRLAPGMLRSRGPGSGAPAL